MGLHRVLARAYFLRFPHFTIFTRRALKYSPLFFNREVGAPIGVQPAGA
jgi:hypothetical protein